MKAVFLVPGGAIIVEIGVEGGNPARWYFRVNGELRTPAPAPDARDSIERAVQCARADIIHHFQVQGWLQDLLTASIVRWSGVIVAALGLLGWWNWALEGKIIPFGGKAFDGFFVSKGYSWHWSFAALCLGSFVLGLCYSLPIRLALLRWNPPPLPKVVFQQVHGREDFPFQDASAALAFYWAYLEHVFQKLQQEEVPIPDWSQKLLEASPACVASAVVRVTGDLIGIGGWQNKLHSIHNDPSSELVLLSSDDMEVVRAEWCNLTNDNDNFCWQPYKKSGCQKADTEDQDRRLKFLAGPSTIALLKALNPHHGGYWWAVLKVGLACALLIPIFPPPCPNPDLEVSFPGRMCHFGADGICRVKMSPEESFMEMELRAQGCGEEKVAKWTAKATSEVFLTTLKGGPQKEVRSRQLVCNNQPEMFLLKPQKREVHFTVDSTPDSECCEGEPPMPFILVREER